MSEASELDRLVQAVRKSAKYKYVSVDLVRRIGAQELAVRRNSREAIKTTKRKLHQVGGAYLRARIDWDRQLRLLKEAHESGAADSVRRVCRDIMRLHTSTSERLTILDEFFVSVLGDLSSVHKVLDIACGLNPLALSWMPFDDQTEYYAYDIYSDMMAFLQEFLALTGQRGRAEARDVLGNPPTQPVDLAMILKSLPCLEQVDGDAAAKLFDAINAKHMLVSFPVRTLGGRDKGMLQNYEERFRALAAGRKWDVQRFEFATELAFLVQTE